MNEFQRDIERFLRTGTGDFETFSLKLFSYQFEKNLPYQAYCRSLEQTPASVKRWQDIPAVPIRSFKSVQFATFSVGHCAALFQSSGTTQKTPSRHYLKTLTYYEEAVKKSFREHVLHDDVKRPMFILTPPPSEALHSSLTWMFEVVKNKWGTTDSSYFVQRGQLDTPRLTFLMGKTVQKGLPVVLLGTTLAYLKLFEDLEKSGNTLPLPLDSVLLDTGGMKTAQRDVTREEFIALAKRYLDLDEKQCVNEYGMCELSSQFYGRGSSSWLQGPPWVRTRVIHPDTGKDAAQGKTGLLQHVDLANVDSVMAIQTEDVGRMEDDGFYLLGRAQGADLKSCSLAAERFFERPTA